MRAPGLGSAGSGTATKKLLSAPVGSLPFGPRSLVGSSLLEAVVVGQPSAESSGCSLAFGPIELG